MDWKQLLAYITGSVDQELLLWNEYLVTENRLLRQQIKGRIRLSDAERKTLAEIGKKLGKQALAEIATIVKPDTILAWHRQLVAQKFDGSQQRQSPGRPKIDRLRDNSTHERHRLCPASSAMPGSPPLIRTSLARHAALKPLAPSGFLRT
jgi:hypothetical protein